MSKNATDTQQPATEPNGTNAATATGTEGEQNGAPEEVDYKAKYEETLGHSREWERRAKANSTAADELQKLKDAKKTDEEKETERIQILERENAEFRAQAQQSEWARQVSEATKVPASVLRGSTLEQMQAHAELLKPAFAAPQKPADVVPTVGQQPAPAGNVSLTDQIAAATAAGETALVATLKAMQLGGSN